MFVVKAKSDFAAKRVEHLYDAMKENKKCDSIFTVRGQRFYVHLIVLSACSEFFERNKDKLSEVFSPFDFDVIDGILKYCYTGEISIDDNHYEKLIELANRLEVKIPPRYETVDLSNCLEVLRLTNDSELKTRAMDLTQENFNTLHKTQDFLKLPASTVIKILKSNYLNVLSEEDVFNAVKLWVIYDDANRKNKFAQVMKSVRLSLLSIEFFIDEVITFCHSCAECMTSLRQEFKDKIDKSTMQRETPRRKKEKKMALVGGSNLDTANTIDIYDELNKSWTLFKNIGINKYHFASVVLGDWIVIIGGKNSSNELVTSVEYIDLKSGQKHPLKPLNQARYIFSAVTLRRNSSADVYAIGGSGPTNSVERWNSKTGNWEIISPLLVAVSFHSASVIDGKIFVTGGLTRKNGKSISTNKVQMYSVETNSWTFRAQMIQERERHSSVAFKGKLFVAGGCKLLISDTYLVTSGNIWQTSTNLTELDSVEYYDPNANLWTAFTKLPKPVETISLCCFQNKILSMGGNSSRDVWEYDETSKSWKASKTLSRERRYAIAHVIPYDSII
ncbi:kelch-like protein 7 [Arctopsyche grandis]|uniref:kelch-like protein 7 n=1 Tax=Arctopsyche grandis TaxID=121162 RepID=UPI00406D6578